MLSFQDEFDEIETAYTEEKRLLIELEERFEKLKEEYDKVRINQLRFQGHFFRVDYGRTKS